LCGDCEDAFGGGVGARPFQSPADILARVQEYPRAAFDELRPARELPPATGLTPLRVTRSLYGYSSIRLDSRTMNGSRYACPCCGYLTLREAPPGTFAICPVCYWEDDDVQFKTPTYAGGANRVSLVEARKNFRAYGAVQEGVRTLVRSPLPEETN
jgi:rubredoxin